MINPRKGTTLGAGVGAILLGIGGLSIGVVVTYNLCGRVVDPDLYRFCAARLLGIPISATLGAILGLCPATLVGAFTGGIIGALTMKGRATGGPASTE